MDNTKLSVGEIAPMVDEYTIHAPGGKSFNFIGFARAIEAKVRASRATDAPEQGEPTADQLMQELAAIRDLFPIPDGGPLEMAWGAACGDPMSVSHYVKESLAVLAAQGEQMPSGDALYAAWHKVGADVAGLKWADFVAALAASPVAADKPVAYLTADKRMLVFADRIDADRAFGMTPLYAAPVAASADAAPAGAVATEAMRQDVYMALHYDMNVQNPNEWGAADKAIAAVLKHVNPTAAEVTPAPARELRPTQVAAHIASEIKDLGGKCGRQQATSGPPIAPATDEACAHCNRLPGDPDYCDWSECPGGTPAPAPATAAGSVPDDVARDAKRWQYIEDHASSHGGGHGFTITCFVPVDHEDMGCGIDAAVAADASAEGGKEKA